jgi:desumoylating isopeptidase 1
MAKENKLLPNPTWHSTVVVFGVEYSFGEDGQSASDPIKSIVKPDKIHLVGNTFLRQNQLEKYLIGMSPEFSEKTYHVGDKNCNMFTQAVCEYLCDEVYFPIELEIQRNAEKAFGGLVNLCNKSVRSFSSFHGK